MVLFHDRTGTSKLNRKTVPVIKRKGKAAKQIKMYPPNKNTGQQLPTNGTPYVSTVFHSMSSPGTLYYLNCYE